MEEKEKRPENEALLQASDEKEESESVSSEKKESKSIVTDQTATWDISKELEARLQGENNLRFTFEMKADDSVTGKKEQDHQAEEKSKQDEPALETVSAEEKSKTEEAGETTEEQAETETTQEVAEHEMNQGAQQEKERAAEQKEGTGEPEEPVQEAKAGEKRDELENTIVLDIKDLEQRAEAAAEQKEGTGEPEEPVQAQQERKPAQETKAEEKRDGLENTTVLNIRDLREEQPAEQKQPASQKETTKRKPSFSIRKKLAAVVAALFLVAAGWIGIAFASGEDGQSVSKIFGFAPDQLIFQFEQKTFAFDLEAAGFDGKDPKTVNRQKLAHWIEGIRKQVERPARDANQERLGEPITPEQVGRKLDMEKLNQMLADFTSIMNKPQKLPVIEIQPKVTKADLEKVDQYLIGSYTTSLADSSENRLNNIRLASKAIHNLILMPGEKFSFNEVVGERTRERGYKEAGVIVKGEYSEGIGGGICQVSSTLYNSVDEAGLKILRRFSHSARVGYVPPGRDATVSWGGPDFRFQNNLDKPIVIKVFIKDGLITVNTYTVPGTKVEQRYVPKAPGV